MHFFFARVFVSQLCCLFCSVQTFQIRSKLTLLITVQVQSHAQWRRHLLRAPITFILAYIFAFCTQLLLYISNAIEPKPDALDAAKWHGPIPVVGIICSITLFIL